MPPTADHLPDTGDDRTVAEIVDRHVRSLVDWYQRKKRWPRRLHRATTVAVILLGAAIPLLSVSDPSDQSRIVTAAVGVTVSGLTGLATVTDWQRRWQIFTSAQTALEVQLAAWEMTITEASLAEPDQARQMRVEATKQLLTAATTVRLSETEEFFVGQPQLSGTGRLAPPASPAMTSSRFLITHGPNAEIRCVTCRKATRLVPGPDGDVGRREVAHYKRTHLCGPADEPWDVESAEEKAS